MAAANLLALLDDIATLLDDVSVMTKVAVKKTAGVLGDDLAVNAEQVSGVNADRELPVVWAVAKGSFVNKLILVPAALAISAFLPWLITPLLMLGGIYLCFEGFEKIAHWLFHRPQAEDQHDHDERVRAIKDPSVDIVAFERDKIRGAIRTDFILSAEIIVIALGTVQGQSFAMQALVVSLIAVLMTIGVYGFVAGIVKLDDAGLYLSRDRGDSGWAGFKRTLGRGLLWFAPLLMKLLGIVGTLAMFLVGGGILAHGIPALGELLHPHHSGTLPALQSFINAILPTLANMLIGLIAGGLAYIGMELFALARGKAH
ncbi:MAG TPA: DUF808 domain-containing protein [Thiolinea sp.]|nr:DUF808 domain-containing protein [Thiolinea sp.]